MAETTYSYFYSTNSSGGGYSLDGSTELTLSEDANYFDGDYLDAEFSHYQSQKTSDGGNVQEPITGDDGNTYYYRGTIEGSDGNTYAVFGSAPLGGSGKEFAGPKDFYIASNEEIAEDTTFTATINTGDPTPVCYLSGTLISTPSGERLIEYLSVGDEVITNRGLETIKFIGRSTRSLSQLREADKMPICIRAGAFGELGPHSDLWISSSHALMLSGSLVEAGALINGTSVTQPVDHSELVLTYHNIELEQHGLVVANGLEVESYFSNWRANGFSRESWDNYADYLERYGEEGPMVEMDVPRIPFARQLPAEIRLMLQMNEASFQSDESPALSL